MCNGFELEDLCEKKCLLEIGNVKLLESKVKGMWKNEKLKDYNDF